MKLKHLIIFGIALLVVAALIGAGAYFVELRYYNSLTKVISKLKRPVILGGIGLAVIVALGAGAYYLKSRGNSNRNRWLGPVLGLGVIFCLVTAGAGYGGYKLAGKPAPNQTAANSTPTSNPETKTALGLPTRNVLSVNYTVNKYPFTNKLLGVNFVNWEHSWGKPYPFDVKGLVPALKAAHVGLIRYAGGNWSNTVGWDREAARAPYTGWPDAKNGPYWFHYNKDEIDNVAKLAQALNADVMIEVNITNSDPAMWADMVRYTNVEHNYGFKYWELGNELDALKGAPSPDEYTARVNTYLDAMLAVDPSIKITASGVASAYDAIRLNYDDSVTALSQYLSKPFAATSPKGNKVQSLSYHWYQACNANDATDLQRYAWPDLADNSWRNNYSRRQADVIPERIRNEITKGTISQGITELNFDSCNYDNPLNGNYLNALWTSDVLGRLGSNGVDYATRWQAYGTQAFSMLYTDGDKLKARPAYYAYLMYANYFGNQMVESNTNDVSRLSIWASRDTTDPTKLKLMVTNLSESDLPATVNLPGFNTNAAQLYQLKSTNPASTDKDSLTAAVTINGVSVDMADVAGSLAAINPTLLPVSGQSLTYTFPAYSTTAIVLNGQSGPIPTPDPNAPPTPTIGLLPTPTPAPKAAFVVKADVSSPTVKAGQAINVTTNVEVDNQSANVLINTEVYCSSDNKNWTKDFQDVQDNQKFSAGQKQSYPITFTVPPGHADAQCYIKVGVFAAGWAKQLAYFDVGEFVIGKKPAP